MDELEERIKLLEDKVSKLETEKIYSDRIISILLLKLGLYYNPLTRQIQKIKQGG